MLPLWAGERDFGPSRRIADRAFRANFRAMRLRIPCQRILRLVFPLCAEIPNPKIAVEIPCSFIANLVVRLGGKVSGNTRPSRRAATRREDSREHTRHLVRIG